MEIGVERFEELEPTVQEIKDHIKACMRKEAAPIQVYYGGRGSGGTYKLLAAMEECLRELAETNEALVSNQKAMAETTDALLKRINAALKELEFGNVEKAKSILWDGLNGESDS